MEESRIALVTGASGAIGAAIACALADLGMDLAVHFKSNQDGAERTAANIRDRGQRALVVQADVRTYDSVALMATTISDELGPPTVLVNNAGLAIDNLATFMTDDQWNEVLDTNLKGSFHCIKALSRGMARQRWGRIVNMSSDAGLMGDMMRANYASAKAGLVGLTKTMARELAASRVTVNAVAPGYIETAMTADMKEAKREKSIGRIPMGRFGRPDEVASVIAFLVSDAAAYMTGQVICIDGGMRTRD